MISNTALYDNHINWTANKLSGMSRMSVTLYVIFETLQIQIQKFRSNVVVHILQQSATVYRVEKMKCI